MSIDFSSQEVSANSSTVPYNIGGRQCFLPAEVAGQGVRIARYCLAEINLGNPGSCSRKLSVEVVCGSLSRDSFQLLTIH